MKSILVHIDASPRSAERLAIAQRLSKHHGAELTAMYAVLPAMLATPWAAAGEGMSSASAVMAEIDRTQRERARATFDRAASRGPVLWLESEGETTYWAITQRALLNDLVVLGQHDPSDAEAGALPTDFVPSLIADAGRPTLVVPYAGSFESATGHVLVAWKPTREAARAVGAALPWLLAAKQVHLAARRENDTPDEGPFVAIEHWLRLHGVQGHIAHHDLGKIEVGEGLLSLATDTAADLLVMGCYGHSRAREWVLGGASRTVLKSMTVPVLMAH